MRARQAAQRPRSTSQLITGMFCQALIGALHAGQAERGVLRLKRSDGAEVIVVAALSAERQQLDGLGAPLALQHDGQPVDDDVEKAADHQPQHEHRPHEQQGAGCVEHGEIVQHELNPLPAVPTAAVYPTTEPSLKIGRYIAITMPPTSTPRIAMMIGSSRLDMLSTALSTSAS